MTFADIALNATFFLGIAHCGPLLKKSDRRHAIVLSTSTVQRVDPSAIVTPM